MTYSIRSPLFAANALFWLFIAAPAAAQLPDGVKAMIDAAIATGDPEKVGTVIELARQTHPDDSAEIDALANSFATALAERKAEQAAAKEQAIRTAGLFENWSGKGEIGAFRATGNSENIGVSAAVSLTRTGIDWTHKLRGSADYQRSNGVTTREQFFAAYEPRYQIDNGLFAYGLVQWERDRFQGFSSRYAASAGIGYRVIDNESMQLAVKAGPAFRRTEFVAGGSEDKLAALAAFDFDWSITDRLTLTQDTNMVANAGSSATIFIDSTNTSLNVVTGLEAKISDRLTTRLSYAVEYDSNPPEGAVSTDTLTRFTLVYGF